MAEREVTVRNRLGLHARASARFVHKANEFLCSVRIRFGEREVNGKSLLGVLTLAASQGSLICLITEGPDEVEALEALGYLDGD